MTYAGKTGIIELTVGLNSYDRPPDRMAKPHRHQEMEMLYLERGKVEYLFGSDPFNIPGRTLVLFWAGRPHQVLHASTRANILGLEIPLENYLKWNMPDGLTQKLFKGQVLLDSGSINASLDSAMLKRWNRCLRGDREGLHQSVLLEVQARLWRFIASYPEILLAQTKARDARMETGKTYVHRVEKMAQFIAEHYLQPVSSADLSRAIGMTPDFTMKLFRKSFGCNLADYVNQFRIAHAKHLLCMTAMPITEIGLDAGFGSLSRFNAVFNKVCRCSPREYRRKNKRI